MKTLYLTIALIFVTGSAIVAQDSLSTVRKLFTTKVYKNRVKMNNKTQTLYFNKNLAASKKNKLSKVLLFTSPIVAGLGGYMAYDAIKGQTLYTQINGESVAYTKRDLPQLIGGIFLLATGGCLMEFSNDLKSKSVELYNSGIKQNKVSINFGITPSGKTGIFAVID